MTGVDLVPGLAGLVPVLVVAGWLLTPRPVPAGARPRHDPRRWLTGVVDGLGRRTVLLLGPRWRTRTAHRLRAAAAVPRSPARHAGIVVAGVGVAAGVVTVPVLLGQPLALLVPVLVGAVAEADLGRRARRRQAVLDRQIAALVDTVTVVLRAGAPLRRALLEVGAALGGTIAEEVAAIGRDLDVGVDLAEALTAFEERTDAPGVTRLVTAIRRSERLGTPVADALTRLASERRAAAAHAVRRRAARAEPRMSAVVVLTFVPATLALVLVGLVTATDGIAVLAR